jgi:type VI secretion system protein ImpF
MARASSDDPVRLSILDRLIDDRGADPAGRHGQSARFLRETVRRDLEDMLNTKKPWSTWPAEWAELDDSLVNYGIPDFTGMTFAHSGGNSALIRVLEEAIRRFEPRLKNVQIEITNRRADSSRQLRFRVKAVLRMDPYTEPVSFESEVEPATRKLRIRDSAQ